MQETLGLLVEKFGISSTINELALYCERRGRQLVNEDNDSAACEWYELAEKLWDVESIERKQS